MGDVRWVQVTTSVVTVQECMAAVADASAGATVSFSGDVRDVDHGRAVSSLTYEGHPTAEQILRSVAETVAAKHPVVAIAVAHRVGQIALGESALVAAVSSEHRGEAFAACTELVEQVKAELPVWKHQVFADGSEEWVNCA